MSASKILTTAVATATIVGAIGFASAQTASDSNTGTAQGTPSTEQTQNPGTAPSMGATTPSTDAAAPSSSTMPSSSTPSTTDSSTAPSTSTDSNASPATEPAPKADRN